MNRPRLYSVNEAASYASVSRSLLYNEWKRGNLQFIKLRSATRIEADELDRWINDSVAAA